MFSSLPVWFRILFAELTITNFAFFIGQALVAVHLATVLHFPPVSIALALFCYSFGLRYMRVISLPVVARLHSRQAILGGIITSFIGYLLLANASTLPSVALALLLVGTGYGINGMTVTGMASLAREGLDAQRKHYLFIWMNMATNLAALVSPLVANWLWLDWQNGHIFYVAAGIMLLSFACVLRLPMADMPSLKAEQGLFLTMKRLLGRPRFWQALLWVVLGWTLYTQKFALTPLYVAQSLAQPQMIGSIIAANAVLIMALSLPMAHLLGRFQLSTRAAMALGFGGYALSYGIIAALPPMAGLVVGIIGWSLAEAVLMPALNSIIAEESHTSERLPAYSLAALAIGTGEAAGNMGGVGLHSSLPAAQAYVCLAMLGLLAVFAMLVCRLMMKRKEYPYAV